MPRNTPRRLADHASARAGRRCWSACGSSTKETASRPRDLERIFDKFYRAGRRGPKAGRHRLGPAICRGFVEAMGGTITRRQPHGSPGAVFTISLPVAGRRGCRPRRSPHDRRAPAPLRVLVVDDEPAIRRFLRAGLSSQGYLVIEAADGIRRARRGLRRQRADLLVLDLGLPDIDGLEVIGRIARARARRCRSSCCRAGATRRARSRRSISAPTTTSPSRSASTSCWPASAPR